MDLIKVMERFPDQEVLYSTSTLEGFEMSAL